MRSVPSARTCTTTTSSSGGGGTLSVEDWGTTASKPTEYFGMIIKITRSTSKISINGTTFISETVPRLPPTDIAMIHLVWEQLPGEEDSHILWRDRKPADPAKTLLTGFELGGDQANLIDAGAAHDVNGAGDVHEQYIAIAFNESDF